MGATLVAWVLVGGQVAATLHGRVIDAQTSSPVAHVRVLLDGETGGETDARGEFNVPSPSRSRVEIMITAVGYGFVKRTILLAAGLTDLGTIALNRESASLAELVTVTGASRRDADAALHTRSLDDPGRCDEAGRPVDGNAIVSWFTIDNDS